MDEAALAQLVEMGTKFYIAKWFATAIHFLWVFDYLLTLKDEIEYAWNGRRSWVFVLFIANRYSPVPHIIWYSALLYSYTSPFCQYTKWLGFAYSTLVMVLAHITIALRIYAITEKNKWVGSSFLTMITAQLVFGIYATVVAAMSPMQQLPDINLDPFKFCAYKYSKLGELIFVNIGVAFDILAFFVIFNTAKKPRYPGMPSLLDTILRDATIYFVLIFTCRIVSDLVIIFAPPSFPLSLGIANPVLVPLMASRLMLSLKKVSVGPTRVWSLSTMTNVIQGFPGDGTLRFTPLRHVPATPAPPNSFQEGVELASASRPSMEDKLLPSY